MCVPGGARVTRSVTPPHFCTSGHTERATTMRVSTWRSQTQGKSAHAIAVYKSTKHITPFQCKHAFEFGLKIVELEKKGNMSFVMGVHYLLCVYHGQYVRPMTRKRKPTDNIHIFKVSLIKQHYLSHLKQHYLSHLKQHVETLEEYNELSINGKKAYFDGKVKRANTMHMYIDTN